MIIIILVVLILMNGVGFWSAPATRRTIPYHASRPISSPAKSDGLATVLPGPVP